MAVKGRGKGALAEQEGRESSEKEHRGEGNTLFPLREEGNQAKEGS